MEAVNLMRVRPSETVAAWDDWIRAWLRPRSALVKWTAEVS